MTLHPFTMQTLLGLLFFSVLLTKAFSLQCEKCNVPASTCTAKNVTCPPDQDVCYSLLLETKEKSQVLIKDCIQKAKCEKLKGERGNPISSEYGSFPKDTIVKNVECNKAPKSSASLLLTVSGLLLMKFLF